MNQKFLVIVLACLWLVPSRVYANICGTDFQNFNPITNGLDFVTVHSSETLKPCIINFGLFLNYAANTLSYSQSYGGSTAQVGQKVNDRILGADFSLGVGLSSNWDVGVNFPAVLSQEIKDTTGATYYDKNGITEFKVNTKYRFYGDDSGGFAGIFSMNNNLIQGNPFSGSGAGPTMNFELAADTSISDWALALNAGYRKRTPGSAIPNQPFLPLKDQFIFSMATSYLMRSIDTKVIVELYGSSAVNSVDYDADRSLNALEWLGGIKHDLNHNVAFHFGGGTKVSNAIGSPDWRVYSGINWALGTACDQKQIVEKVEVADYSPPLDEGPRVVNDTPIIGLPSTNSEDRFEGKLPQVYRFNAEIFFDFDSDKIRAVHVREIESLIRDLANGGFKRLEIDGHTDSIGKASYNLDLSRRRADSVKKYLVEKYHALPDRIITKGLGSKHPIADNGNFQGRQRNRRVEFKVWK